METVQFAATGQRCSARGCGRPAVYVCLYTARKTLEEGSFRSRKHRCLVHGVEFATKRGLVLPTKESQP